MKLAVRYGATTTTPPAKSTPSKPNPSTHPEPSRPKKSPSCRRA
jgi:hypothetical protein